MFYSVKSTVNRLNGHETAPRIRKSDVNLRSVHCTSPPTHYSSCYIQNPSLNKYFTFCTVKLTAYKLHFTLHTTQFKVCIRITNFTVYKLHYPVCAVNFTAYTNH